MSFSRSSDRGAIVMLLVALLAAGAEGRAQNTAPRAGATVSGVVYDSISLRPLAGALVQLVRADNVAGTPQTSATDAAGSFSIVGVPDGRYLLSFLHPVLDSLGVEPPVRELVVAAGRSPAADIAVPSPDRLRAAICGARSVRDSSAVIVGVVRDARTHEPVAGAAVTGEWREFSIGADGLTSRIQRVGTTTAHNGWYSLCDVPSPGSTTIAASRDADSTSRGEISISGEAVVRRDLYVGAARTVARADSARPAGTPRSEPRILRTGEGRLSGTVTSINTGAPVADAQVVITDGSEARTNARGEWILVDVPLGTRTLEVRAVGYYPDRRSVNVFEGAPSVHVALTTFRAVLDTVRVTASRWLNEHRSGFLERRRQGLGRYLGPEEIARRAPVNASDLFRGIAGVATDAGTIRMRRGDTDCSPSFYLDGVHISSMTLGDLTADDIDSWVRPHEIAGIEVYSDVVPPQFQQILLGCGSIVIWTR